MKPDQGEQQPPKINFSGLVVGTPAWDAARAEVMDALETYGCFELVHDQLLDPKLREQVFKQSLTDLLAMPTDVKSRSSTFKSNQYVENVEVITIGDGKPESGIPSFTTLMWPQGNPHFCETMQRYSDIMKELHQMVKRMIMEGLGVDKYCHEMFQNTTYELKASYYQDLEHATNKELYMGGHTDPCLLTTIGQDEADGLEVLIKKSQSWFRPAPYTYTVLISDVMEAWTNGRVQATRHRVIKNKNHRTRYVTLFFSRGSRGFTVKTPPELIGEAHPALYNPFDNTEYVQAYPKMAINGAANGSTALQSFCGIKN